MGDVPARTEPAVSRRAFLGAGAALSGAAALPAAHYRRVRGAGERVGVGFIGFGLIGKRHVLDFKEQPDANLVAVAEAHAGRLELDEGPGKVGELGPGLRVALILPRAA